MKFTGYSPWDEIAFLNAQDTKYLLSLRTQCLRVGSGEFSLTDDNTHVVHHRNVVAVLSTREHIMSKSESKTLRRIMSKTGLTKGQVMDNPTLRAQVSGAQQKRLMSSWAAAQYAEAAPSVLRHVRIVPLAELIR
jgi:hypothetical protein